MSGTNIYVVWADNRNGNRDIYFNYSTDGGANWQSSDIRLNTDPAGADDSRYPQVAVYGASVYVTWEACRNGDWTNIYLNYSTDGGANWQESDMRLCTDLVLEAYSSTPQIAVAGNSIYAVWQDERCGNADIYLNYSTDGGANWQSSDIRLGSDVPGSAHSSAPQIAVSGADVFVVWEDYRNGACDIYLNYSTDGGTTWQRYDKRLNTDAAGTDDSQFPQIWIFGTNVYVVWWDSRNGGHDIYLNYSADGGMNWQTSDIRLDTDPAGAADSENPQIAVSGASIYVTWQDYRNGACDIYMNCSTDGGLTWQMSDARLDTDPAGATNSENPQIAVSGAGVYVTWQDYRNGACDIYMNCSMDGGMTWQTSDTRLDTDPAGAAYSENPWIGVNGSNIYVVWADDRNGNRDIYYNYSTDSGANWQASDTRLDTDSIGTSDSHKPQIAVSGDAVCVVWRDNRNGNWDIFLNYSTDRGANWQTSDIRLDTDATGTAHSWDPQIVVSGDSVKVVWEDERNGFRDIYFTCGAVEKSKEHEKQSLKKYLSM
jgi:Neuraminidase (sialidase)